MFFSRTLGVAQFGSHEWMSSDDSEETAAHTESTVPHETTEIRESYDELDHDSATTTTAMPQKSSSVYVHHHHHHHNAPDYYDSSEEPTAQTSTRTFSGVYVRLQSSSSSPPPPPPSWAVSTRLTTSSTSPTTRTTDRALVRPTEKESSLSIDYNARESVTHIIDAALLAKTSRTRQTTVD